MSVAIYYQACKKQRTHFAFTILVKTNKSNYEIYALLGEVHGSGCPLGYILLQTSADGATGGKQRFLEEFLRHFREKWNISAKTTLTDKDWSEINAFLTIFPEAKHQLCYWHCRDAIKKRMAILRRRPVHYNVQEARADFPFIDENFVPIAQSQELNPVSFKWHYIEW